jgi:hypothetical protein
MNIATLSTRAILQLKGTDFETHCNILTARQNWALVFADLHDPNRKDVT